LQAQLTTGEGLVTLPCTPTIQSNHHEGTEATAVQVTVSENCKGVAYNKQALQTKATQLLTNEEAKKLGAAYALLDMAQVTVQSVALPGKTSGVFSIAVKVTGIWIYQINQREQEAIKRLVAGKQKSEGLYDLLSLPGVQRAQIEGISDNELLPDDLTRIHLVIVFMFTVS